MKLTISEAARCAGVSVRTLHYYDAIGLLPPSEVSDAGYRFYDETALSRLQQILFFRELEFPLRDIADILSRPDYDQTEALRRRRALLLLKRQRLNALIELVDDTIGGELTMKHHTPDLNAARRQYAAEAAEKWGKTDAYAESCRRHSAYTDEQAHTEAEQADALFAAFASHMDCSPDSPEAQALAERWRAHITRWHYPCSIEIFASLGQMYAADPRFAETLDRFGDGNAQFMSDVIACYCANAKRS